MIEWGPLKLHSYGVMIFLAFVFGLWLGVRRGRPVGFASGDITDFIVWIMISSLVGARLTYVVAHWSEFAARPLDAISPIQSDGTIGIAGLVVLGGVAAAIPTTFIFARKRRLPFWKLTDVMMPSLAFGLAIGRVGCYLNGCCFGLPTSAPWGVIFPNNCLAGAVFPGVRLHPTQLYDLLYNAVIGLLLLWRSPKKRFEGELFADFLLLYGLARIWVESLRYYEASRIPLTLFGLPITGSMLASAAMIAGGVYLLMKPPVEARSGGKR